MARTTSNTPLLIDGDSENIEVIDFFTEGMGDTTDAQAKIEAMASALRDDSEAFLNIGKLSGTGANQPEQFCARVPADKYDIGQLNQFISETFGAGDYRVRLYAKGKVRANKLVTIAARVNNGDKNTPHGEAAGILETVLARMEAQNRQMMEILSRQQSAPQTSRMDMLQEMMLFKQLFSSNEKPTGGVSQFLETVEGLKALGIQVGGAPIESEKEEGFGDLLEKMTPLIGAALQQNNTAQTAPKIDPSIVRQRQVNMIQKVALKAKLEPFIKASIKKSAPETYAELLIDQIGEKTATQYAGDTTTLTQLAELDPRIAQNISWFSDVMEHVKAQLGMPSRFSDLYESDDSAIDSNTIDSESPDDEQPDV